MKRLFSFLFILCTWTSAAEAQSPDSLPAVRRGESRGFRASYAAYLLPGALITYGALTQAARPLRRLDERLDAAVGNHSLRMDDYLQYAPAAAVYGLDWAGLKAKRSFRDRTFVMASSHLLMAASTYAVKHAAGVMRPDGSSATSFPSGHTATAFTGAHILFREYGEAAPWVAAGGYAAATATGFMRILNHKHWLSDVAAGAGLGILCAEAGYLLLPLFRKLTGEGAPALVAVPLAGGGAYGLGFACRF
jgi:hypothetical protein